jgi:hypothetical protein
MLAPMLAALADRVRLSARPRRPPQPLSRQRLREQFVGLDNFEYLLRDDPNFWPAVTHNALLLLGLPIMLVLALVVAFLIHDGVRSRRLSTVYRSLVFLPFVLSIVVVGPDLLDLPALGRAAQRASPTPRAGASTPRGSGNSDWALPSVLGVIVWRSWGSA